MICLSLDHDFQSFLDSDLPVQVRDALVGRFMVSLTGFEPVAFGLEGQHSVH